MHETFSYSHDPQCSLRREPSIEVLDHFHSTVIEWCLYEARFRKHESAEERLQAVYDGLTGLVNFCCGKTEWPIVFALKHRIHDLRMEIIRNKRRKFPHLRSELFWSDWPPHTEVLMALLDYEAYEAVKNS